MNAEEGWNSSVKINNRQMKQRQFIICMLLQTFTLEIMIFLKNCLISATTPSENYKWLGTNMSILKIII